MVDWSKIGRHAQYGNGLKRAKYRGWLYPVVVVVGSLLVHLLQDDRRRSLAKTNIVVYVFGSILHVIPWETPRAYVLALAADFCAITASNKHGRLVQNRPPRSVRQRTQTSEI